MEYPNTASNDESSSTRSHCNGNGSIDDIKVCQVCSIKGNEFVLNYQAGSKVHIMKIESEGKANAAS